jgi:hypothetical protein
MKHLKTWTMTAALLLIAVAVGAQAPPDVTGTWQLDVQTDAGTGTPVLTLKQDGEKLTGHYKSQIADTDITGTIKGSELTFAFDASIQGETIRITYTGTVEKDAMKGSVQFGTLGTGTFKGTKKAQ